MILFERPLEIFQNNPCHRRPENVSLFSESNTEVRNLPVLRVANSRKLLRKWNIDSRGELRKMFFGLLLFGVENAHSRKTTEPEDAKI